MVVNAVTSVRHVKEDGRTVYPVKSINVLKSHGRSALESEMIDGFAVNATRAAQGIRGKSKDCLPGLDLRKHRMQMNVQVLVSCR